MRLPQILALGELSHTQQDPQTNKLHWQHARRSMELVIAALAVAEILPIITRLLMVIVYVQK
jgi:hypothetical protein